MTDDTNNSLTDDTLIKSHAEEILDAAGVSESPYIFSVNAFATRDISIGAQRRRALNLSWALTHMDKIKNGSVVAVIGAGFAGLTCAISVALLRNCVVLLIDKESGPLYQFLGASGRFVGKQLSMAGSVGGKKNGPASLFDVPLFDWENNYINVVANKWINEFEGYKNKLPIFCDYDTICNSVKTNAPTDKLNLVVETTRANSAYSSSFPVDVCVLATGFGFESNKFNDVKDDSYWKSGSEFHYHPNKDNEKILISGQGDSGLIEVLHYSFKGFSHNWIEEFIKLPANGRQFEAALFDSNYQKICQRLSASNEIELEWRTDSDPSPTAHLKWYSELKNLIHRNPTVNIFPPETLVKEIFELMDEFVVDLIGDITPADDNDNCINYFDRLAAIPKENYEALEVVCEEKLDELLQIEAEAIFEGYAGEFYKEVLGKKDFEVDFEVYWNIKLKGPYSPKISIVNWPAIALLMANGVTLITAEITKVKRGADGFRVYFADGTENIFDRVATRYGPRGLERSLDFTKMSSHPSIEESAILNHKVGTSTTQSDRLFIDPVKKAIDAAIKERQLSNISPSQIEKIRDLLMDENVKELIQNGCTEELTEWYSKNPQWIETKVLKIVSKGLPWEREDEA